MDYANLGRKIVELVKEAQIKGMSESRLKNEIEKLIGEMSKEGEL